MRSPVIATIKTRLTDAFRWFTPRWIGWLLMSWLLAIAEIIDNKVAHGLDIGLAKAIGIAMLNSTLGWLLLTPWNLLIFILVWLASPRIAKPLIKILILIQLVVRLALINYFTKALVPLGADLYGYSLHDIRQTVGAAGGIAWQFILVMVVIIGLQILLFKIGSPSFPILSAIFAAIGLILLISGITSVSAGPNEFTRSLLSDKLTFFAERSWDHVTSSDDGQDIYADSYLPDDKWPGNNYIRHYLDETNYPFLYTDSTKDVLSPFFKKDERPPNIVLILVEGLGRAFTNEQAYLGSFTPFLDSLSRNSLYWENFLSEGGRTFAVLPSLLGSLPFAKNGFLELGNDMPAHASLPGLLKPAQYHSSFYYGGDAHFDNMDVFLRKTGIDEINDQATFPVGYTKIPAGEGGFTWGYSDRELFRRWMDTRPETEQPQLSVILTVSMHSPFLLNEPQEYARRLDQRMISLGFTAEEKQAHLKYKDQYASILYTDQALRDFFAAFSKRKDYAHTIFLITGDHRMPEIPMRDKIDRFHVPLIVYSPLLTTSAQFSSLSTHFDITPSLLAYLKKSYGLHTPTSVAWLGDGLDTARTFRNIHAYPLMQTKTDLVDYVRGEYHLNNGELFRLRPDLSEDNFGDKSIQQQLASEMDQWMQRDQRWMRTKALFPDSLLQRLGR